MEHNPYGSLGFVPWINKTVEYLLYT